MVSRRALLTAAISFIIAIVWSDLFSILRICRDNDAAVDPDLLRVFNFFGSSRATRTLRTSIFNLGRSLLARMTIFTTCDMCSGWCDTINAIRSICSITSMCFEKGRSRSGNASGIVEISFINSSTSPGCTILCCAAVSFGFLPLFGFAFAFVVFPLPFLVFSASLSLFFFATGVEDLGKDLLDLFFSFEVFAFFFFGGTSALVFLLAIAELVFSASLFLLFCVTGVEDLGKDLLDLFFSFWFEDGNSRRSSSIC